MNDIENVGLKCTGCESCKQTCPQNCIEMEQNEEGFLYPKVDRKKCNQCGVCRKHCPCLESLERKKLKQKIYYGVKNRDENRIVQSASGGLSDVIANRIIALGGYVYGAAYNDALEVHHIEINNKKDLWKMQSSKYVQSQIGNCYKMARDQLECGKSVLFTGTPCQIAGLYSFLGKRIAYENLYTIDLICHGVPSPLLFEKYIDYMSEKMGGKIIYYNFRSKEKRGWGTSYLLKTKTKTKTQLLELDKYGKAFMNSQCYRKCCYECQYANMNRIGDITIGDFWGIQRCHPEFFSPKGVSSAILNTKKGENLFKEIRGEVDWIECSQEEIKIRQGNLVAPSECPATRKEFYFGIQDKNFIKKLRVGIRMKSRIKAMVPAKFVCFIKSKI